VSASEDEAKRAAAVSVQTRMDAVAKEGTAERAKLVGRAGIVGAGTLASRLLGLGRDMALAAVFTREETDAFFVAFTIPNALRQLLGEGAMSSAVVPVLSETLAKEGDEPARAFFARIRGVSLVALAIVTALGMIFTRPICELFAAGYHARPGEFERTVSLTRVVFPYIFFMGTAALGMAALHAKRRFAVASFAPGLLNVAFLVAAFALPPVLVAVGIDRVHALSIGALAGGALQVIAQWPALRALGFLRMPVIDLRDPRVREVFRRIVPMTFGIGVYYIDLVLARRFLSELGPGAQSYFAWAMRLCDFPQGIFVMALSTAALPSLATLAAKGATDELAKTDAHGMRLALFVAIPASAALVALAEPVVVTLFERGEFTPLMASETARALMWQGGAIWTVAAVRQLVPVFHALGDTRTPVVVSALDLCAFVALAIALRGPLGHVGISVAVAGSSAVQMALLVIGLKRRLGTVRAAEIGGSVARTLAASAVAGAAGWGIARALYEGPHAGRLARAVPGIAGGVVFVAVFVLAAFLVGSEELRSLLLAGRRRLARRRAARDGGEENR
jgi:putative peptidoglycan lipid II flippase